MRILTAFEQVAVFHQEPVMVPTEHLMPHYTRDYSDEIKGSPEGQSFMEDVRKNGVQKPIEMETDGQLGRIWDGNHRVAAANMTGVSHVPVTFTQRPSEYMKLYGDKAPPLHPSIQQHLSSR